MVLRCFSVISVGVALLPAWAMAQITDLLNPSPQPLNERTFLSAPKEIRHVKSLDQSAPFLHMTALAVQDEENIVIWDTKHFYRWGLQNPEGALKIGDGFGGGPSEYRTPRNPFIRQGILYSVDSEALKILSWDLHSGKFLHTVKQPRGVEGYRMVVDPEGRTAYVLSFLWSPKGQIHRFDLQSGAALETFMKLPDDQKYRAEYCHDGKIVIDEKGHVYHASNNAGNLSKFSPGKSGHIYNVAILSEHKNDCAVYQEKRGRYTVTMRSKTYLPLTIDIDYSEGKIYLLHSGQAKYSSDVVDVYASETGLYLHSLRLRRQANEIAIVGNHLFALEEPSKDVYHFSMYEIP